MDAFDVMTRDAVTVSPDTRMREIARLLLEHGISAVPVVDASGGVIGMVSEGDLLRARTEDNAGRRDWWLAMLAQGESLSEDFLATLQDQNRTAREIMSAPVVTVTGHTDVIEIGKLLQTHRIKRVPVVLDGHIVGIVSRADLVRAFASGHATQPPSHKSALFEWESRHAEAPVREPEKPLSKPGGPEKQTARTASDFRSLVEAASRKKAAEQEAARKAAAAVREHRTEEAIDHHVTDDDWRALLDQARTAAARGETELLVFRFPAALCSDGGRAINVPEPGWPATLRGEAAEAYLRFERELKPLGFHLIARVLDFPGGFLGDIGLYLYWGGAS